MFSGLVAAVGVESEVAEEFAGGGVDDADVEVVDEEEDGLAGVGAAEADVVHSAAASERDGAGLVDAVVCFCLRPTTWWLECLPGASTDRELAPR